jgi:hypothetical protein
LKKIAILTTALICVQIGFVFATSYSPNHQNTPGVVLSATKYIQKDDFQKVAALYLLPAYFTKSQLIEEKKGIGNALKLLSEEFGAISELKVNQEDVRWINLEIFGGDVDFVKSNPRFRQYVFSTNFANQGNGFIIIRVYDNIGDPKLRSVGYALPDLPQNKDILKPIAQKLMNLMFPQ